MWTIVCGKIVNAHHVLENMRILTYFTMRTNFTFFIWNFYILPINKQTRIADILTVIFTLTLNRDCFRK